MKIKEYFDKNGYIAPTLCAISLALNIYNIYSIHKTEERIEEREQMIKMLTEHELILLNKQFLFLFIWMMIK